MNTVDLSSYSREQLQDLLRIMKSYKTSQRQIGSRGQLIHPKVWAIPEFRLEYASGISRELASTSAHALMAVYFPEVPKETRITCIENIHLVGWIRLFYGDDMVDISFQKFMNTLHNSIS